MLADVGDVAKRAGALLDDPSNSIYTLPYLMPFIDQCYDTLDVDLERAGMQYVESIAVINLAAQTSDLSPLMQDGQPLATMKFPKWVFWKLAGQTDNYYAQSAMVTILTDYLNPIGNLQWKFTDGAVQVTPSAVDTTVRIIFDEMSTNIYDPSQGVVRGTAHILAARVAAEVAGARKGMENRAINLDKKAAAWWNAFKTVLVQNDQGKQRTAKPMHPRVSLPTPYVPAPTQD